MDREVLGQDNRGGVGEVMKEEALLEEQAVEQALVEGTEAAKRNQQLGGDAGDHDRVDLDAAQGLGHFQEPGLGRRRAGTGQELGVDRQPPRVLAAERDHRVKL